MTSNVPGIFKRSVRYILLGAVALASSMSFGQEQATRDQVERQIQELYIGILGRAAAQTGLDYWTDQILEGTFTLENTRASFTEQVEYVSIYGSLSNTELVTTLYRNLLEREPAAAGLAYWVQELDEGRINADQMVNAIINAVQDEDASGSQVSEDRLVLSNKVDVAEYFTSLAADYVSEGDFISVAQTVVADVTASADSVLAATEFIDEVLAEWELPDGPVDVYDVILTDTNADCASYSNDYQASVLDIQRSLGFEMSVSISVDDDSCELLSNSIPNHDFNDASARFATDVAEIQRTFRLPRDPVFANTATEISQQYYDAVMLNGVVLDLLSAGCYNPNDPMADQDGNTPIGCNANLDDWLLDPLAEGNGFGTDSHNAHTQPDGTYHYHGNPMALFDEHPGPEGSPVIGFAADGFPIFGSYFLDPDTGMVRKAESGYTLRAGSRGTRTNTNPGGDFDGTYVDDWIFTDAGDLDECNGMTVNGQYGYFVTDTYPWVLKCLKGEVDTSFRK
ncbi:YHYH protein [Pseudomaricurvus alkylphenolicus]|jgi:hypothetical protein|uniref:YHYH protein n=1 Tax=Pseudomaricurvus alkylphenolicus TaxID=1306991 RepID=UPI001422C182|nr:YHYH protein [Pseudomaricurvus alkylphenolicus]NIB39199.1 YHYH protein [Pseudomaricurvus alkylphenolicus]